MVSNYTAYINSVAVRTYGYTYDKLSNITAITSGGSTESEYTYDAQGQLLSETIASQNLKYEYTYDNYGNIQTAKKYNLSTGALLGTESYTYGNSQWLDRLTAFNGEGITYDGIVNPLTYNNGSAYTFTWQNGRELATAVKGSTSVAYKYGADGLRVQKTVNGVEHNYYYSDGLLVREEIVYNANYSQTMDFLYDESGTPYSFIYNTYQYYYVKNMQGDVVAIVDEYGDTAAEYTYDAWGNVIDITEYFMEEIGAANPIRYRSYYYDTDTGFYYLQSRYYDPAIRRFISSDKLGNLAANGDITSLNLYAYCGNNPVSRADDGGEFWNYVIGAGVGAIMGAVSAAISGGDWKAIALGAGVGLVGGLIAASGIPAGIQIIAGGVLSGGSNLATQMFVEEKSLDEVDWLDVGIDTVIGVASSALSYGLTKGASDAAEELIKKGVNKVVNGQQSLLSGSRYGKGAIKTGIEIMENGFDQLNFARGVSSVTGSVFSCDLVSTKSILKRLGEIMS